MPILRPYAATNSLFTHHSNTMTDYPQIPPHIRFTAHWESPIWGGGGGGIQKWICSHNLRGHAQYATRQEIWYHTVLFSAPFTVLMNILINVRTSSELHVKTCTINCSHVGYRFNTYLIHIASLHSNQFIAYTPFKYQDRPLTNHPTYISGFQHRVTH